MSLFYYIFIFISGLIIGSFAGAFSYRLPREISIIKGRSFCPHCKRKISWYDNIPLVSYIILKGKCRKCDKKISLRYPLIELSLGLIFVLLYIFVENCYFLTDAPICHLYSYFGTFTLPYLLIISTNLAMVFVIDFEQKLIPDELVFFNLLFIFIILLIFSIDTLFLNLETAFLGAALLLTIHLVTLGRGMGLGDVKLALPLGLFFGWPLTLIWLYTSVFMGAIVGLILIFFKKASFGKKIAFGPFLVASFFVTLFWGNTLYKILFSFLS